MFAGDTQAPRRERLAPFSYGRFMQTDPVGYNDDMNLYAYVANDPVNGIDPTGMCTGSLISNSDGTCKGNNGFNPTLNGAGTVDGPVPGARNNAAPGLTSKSGSVASMSSLTASSGSPSDATNSQDPAQAPSDIVVRGEQPRTQVAQFEIPPGRFGMLEWLYNQYRDGYRYQKERAEAYVRNCAANAGNVDGGQVAHDAAAGGLKNGATGAAKGAFAGGPEGAALGALKGMGQGTVKGAVSSVVNQACSK